MQQKGVIEVRSPVVQRRRYPKKVRQKREFREFMEREIIN
jgi:hypothetical protein